MARAPIPGGARRRRFAMLAGVVGLSMALLLAEIVLRLTGWRPFEVAVVKTRVDPPRATLEKRDAGVYRFPPGRVRVELSDDFGWTMTHDGDGLRVTGTVAATGGRQVWLMGCSLTHGWSVNDDESYPWLVQESLTNRLVLNGGVSGYGTVHSRLLFQELLERRGRPEIVVYAYGRFHDYRNTFARIWQKGFVPANARLDFTVPRARFGADGSLVYDEVPLVYREWPGQRRSALVHALEQRFNLWESARLRSHDVSREMVAQWAAFCLRERIRFVVAGISSDAGSMLDFCQSLGVETVDLSVPLSGAEFTNLPHDNHPNAKAHREYARRLVRYLQEAD